MTRLPGRRALVTGANGGVGSAVAVRLAREGARVAVHVRTAGAGHQVTAAIDAAGGQAVEVVGDLRTDPAAVVVAAADALGGLDIAVNNAGILRDAPFLELSAEDWRAVIDTNLTGYFLVGQAAARIMAEQGTGGSIVNVSSTREQQAWPGSAAYAASKGGIRMLTRTMALELAPLGIRVNSVAPGTLRTNLNKDYLDDPEFRDRRIATIPVGRYGTAEEVVGAVVFLASDESTFVIGATIAVDGGQTLG